MLTHMECDGAPTAVLARFSSSLEYSDLPAEVVQRAQLLVMDTLAIAVRAQEVDSTQTLKHALRDLEHDRGSIRSPGDAGSWTPMAAALLTSAAAHSLDFDDTHAAAQLHPGAPVIAAALAAAQMVGADTRQLLTGIVAGYETVIRVALGVDPRAHGELGFHPTATTGVFGAAAAAGNILGLKEQQMRHAFGTALSGAGGTGQFAVNGAWTKRFQVGDAAACGLLAATLGRRNFTGAAEALEGKHGFFRVYSNKPASELATKGLGQVWEILRTGIKPYPCCRGIHAAIDAVLTLRSIHALPVEHIAQVRVGLARRGIEVVGEPQDRRRLPRNTVDCQFSTHLCVATAIKHGEVAWESFDAALQDEQIFALMQRIDVHEDAQCEANFPRAFSARVEIRMNDGAVLNEFVQAPRGEPETMLEPSELRHKFSLLVRPSLGENGEQILFDRLNRMHEGGPVSAILDAASPVRGEELNPGSVAAGASLSLA